MGRLRKVFWVALLIAIIVLPIGVAFSVRNPYSNSQVLLDNLSSPIIYDIDRRNWIYFSEFVGADCFLQRYNLRTGQREDLLSLTGMGTHDVEVVGNLLFYFIVNDFEAGQTMLYRYLNGALERIWVQPFDPNYSPYFIFLSKDRVGNVYFFWKNKVYIVPRGGVQVQVLFEIPDHTIYGAIADENSRTPIIYLYCGTVSNGVEISKLGKWEGGTVTWLAERPGFNYGGMTYLSKGRRGLVFIYAQRGQVDSNLWTYMEIDLMSMRGRRSLQGWQVLWSEMFDDRRVAFYVPAKLFHALSRTGDFFFSIAYMFPDGSVVNELLRFDYRSGVIQELVRSENAITFLLDRRGNVIYADTDKIVIIFR